MNRGTIVEAIKSFVVKNVPTKIATFFPESWLPEAQSVEKITGGFFGMIDELEDLAEDKLLEQGDIQKEMLELEKEKAAAVDQQIRAENFALNLNKLFEGDK